MCLELYLDHNSGRAEVKRNVILRVKNLFVGVRAFLIDVKLRERL